MTKTAQQSIPEDVEWFLGTPIRGEELLESIWVKYFADKHKNIVDKLRASFQRDPNLKAALEKYFAGTWPEFQEMPSLGHSFMMEKATLDGLLNVPGVSEAPGIKDAIALYMAQYNAMLQQLQHPSKDQTNVTSKNPAKKPAQPSPKIKRLQQLLGVNSTGFWNQQSNTAFLAWLKANGWDNYISGDRFTGKLDDALRAMLIEKASPTEQQAGPDSNLKERQSARAARLKKIAEKLGK